MYSKLIAMVVLKEVNGIQLNEGNLMAKGLFNLSIDNNVSLWFDADVKDVLMRASDENFIGLANDILSE